MQKKVLKILLTFILIVAVIFTGYKWWTRNSSKNAQTQTPSIARVLRGDLEVVLDGLSGTLQPMDQETVDLKVEGTVKKVYFPEGSTVKKGDLLYELDDPQLSINLQKAQLAIAQAKMNLDQALKQKEKSVIYAPEDGVVKSLNVKAGDNVSQNTVLATTLNENKTRVRVPYNSAQLKNIKLGQKAEVLLLDSLYTVEGTVTKIDNVATPTASGARYYYVTIEMDGNYYYEGGSRPTQVYIINGEMKLEGLEQVAVEPLDTVEIKSEISSKIKEVYIDEGDIVKKGQKLLALDEEDLQTDIERQQIALQQAELDLQSKLREKEDLFVYAPIDGTIVEQNVREGDLIKPLTGSSSNEPAATIVDYSKMQVVLAIDELDISKVKEGMPVKITADALPDQVFEGSVEKIADEGISQNNVSTFDVTVTLDKTPELKAGMTVNAEISVAKKQNVLMLPVEAIQHKDGKSFVIPVKDESAASQGNSSNNDKKRPSPMQMVEVKTGISNDDYIEIMSGLNEGDMVLVPNSSSSINRMSGMMGPMPGPGAGPGMGPGGRPGGGQPPRR